MMDFPIFGENAKLKNRKNRVSGTGVGQNNSSLVMLCKHFQ